MKRIMNSILAIVAVGAVTVSLIPASKPVSAQSPAPVVVVNTPLPVSGTVKVNGAVSLASGTTVNIGNAAGNPVLVQDVRKNQPAHGFNGCFFNGSYCLIDLVTVPAGQRLVVEHISGNVHLNSGSQTVVFAQVGQAYLDCCTVTNDDYLVTQQIPGIPRFQVNHQTLMFFDQGQTVRVLIAKSGSDGSGDSNFSYAGYFLPL